jgi:hypothetical protein
LWFPWVAIILVSQIFTLNCWIIRTNDDGCSIAAAGFLQSHFKLQIR